MRLYNFLRANKVLAVLLIGIFVFVGCCGWEYSLNKALQSRYNNYNDGFIVEET